MEICQGCGVIAPTSKDACYFCSTTFGQSRLTVEPPDDGLMFARLCGEFDCRSCGGKVPLNYFTLEGYRCGSCGIMQKFDWPLWEQIISHAHNTADLTGFNKPSPQDATFWKAFAEKEGDDIAQMFRRIGNNRTTLTKGNDSVMGLEFEMDVSPGNPLCKECGTPLRVGADRSTLRTTCSNCNQTITYALFDLEKAMTVVGTISHETRTDAAAVRAEAASGSAALAISCPNCSGALEIGQPGEIVQCPYCSTPCHVPYRVFQQGSGTAIPKEPWWMVFKGKSTWRVAIEQQAAAAERAARIEEQRQQNAIARQQAQERRKNKTTAMIVVAIGVLVAVGFLVVLLF